MTVVFLRIMMLNPGVNKSFFTASEWSTSILIGTRSLFSSMTLVEAFGNLHVQNPIPNLPLRTLLSSAKFSITLESGATQSVSCIQ